jgi:hypothetical protein
MLKLFAILLFGLAVATATKGAMMGGWAPCSTTDDETVKVATFAVGQVQASSNNLYALTLIKATTCKAQVVSGMNYELTLEIGMTSCHVGAANPPADCGAVTQTQDCVVRVWSQPWVTPPLKLTSQQCGAFVSVANKG